MMLFDITVKEAFYRDIHQRRELWKIFNENIKYFNETIEKVKYTDHCKWWYQIFEYETIYIIEIDQRIIGYIRINKETKEVSIAIKEDYQNSGIGTIAIERVKSYKKTPELKASILSDNHRSIHFFKKNKIPVVLINV